MQARTFSRIALLCSVLALPACSKRNDAPPQVSAEQSTTAVLNGTVHVLEPATLSEQAELEVSLTNVSGDDGAVEVAKQRFPGPIRLPMEFSLTYDGSAIQSAHRYTVAARILENEQVLFATDTAYPVITQGNPSQAAMQLTRSGATADPITQADASATAETKFEGELRTAEGTLRYASYFQGSELKRIEQPAASGLVTYEFLGARLLRYAAKNETSGEALELQFDERGKLVNAMKQANGQSSVPAAAEINTVRNRAALLRSRALADAEAKGHRAAGGF